MTDIGQADLDSVRHGLIDTGMAHQRSFIDRTEIVALADTVSRTLTDLGWVRPGSLRPDRCPGFGDTKFATGYAQIQRLEEFHKLAEEFADKAETLARTYYHVASS